MFNLYFKKSVPHIIAMGIFLLTAFCFCRPVLEGKVLNQTDVVQWKGMAQQSLEYQDKYGHLPLWSESAYCGMPAYTFAMGASSKISTGYLNMLLTPGLPKPVNFLFLACICFYLLTQVMRVNPWIGIMASIGYAYATFNPIIIAVGHETQVTAIAYAPAIIAGLILIYRQTYLTGAAIFAIFLGFQLSTQHMQIVYYTGILCSLLTIAFLIHSAKEKTFKKALAGISVALAAAVVGFGTFAVSVLPLHEYAAETKRGGKTELVIHKDDKQTSVGGLGKSYAFEWNYGIAETFTLLVPGIYGGGEDGKLVTGNSAFAEKAKLMCYPQQTALDEVNQWAYWGKQPVTAGPVYLGAIICFLSILGCFYIKSWHKWWIISAAILGIAMAWGENFAAFNYFIFDHLPYYNKFRALTQALFMTQFAFPLLAALGLQAFLFNQEPIAVKWKKIKPAVYIAAALMVVAFCFYVNADFKGPKDYEIKAYYHQQIVTDSLPDIKGYVSLQVKARSLSNDLVNAIRRDRESILRYDLIRTGLLLLTAILLTALFAAGKIKRAYALAGFVIISSFDLLSEGMIYLNEDNFMKPADYQFAFRPSPADTLMSREPIKNFRVWDQASETPWDEDARASYYHNSVGGYSPAKLGLYQDILDSQLLKGNAAVFNMLNTKYITRRTADGEVKAKLNPNAYGPCWLVKNIHYVKDGTEEMKALDSIDVKHTAIVQQNFENIIPGKRFPYMSASLKLIENLNDKITYAFSSLTNQFAVFSEVYYNKGWNAYIDGNKTAYCKVNYILRGMALPPGKHTIEFRFEPSMYEIGNEISVWASLLTYCLLTAAIIELILRSKRKFRLHAGKLRGNSHNRFLKNYK